MLMLLAWLLQADSVVLDNEYVRVTRNGAPCAIASAACGDRVLVALGDVRFAARSMKRGDVAVFPRGTSYSPPSSGDYFEVAFKPNHPPAQSPREVIRPAKNAVLFESSRLYVFEERLPVGETRARHSHSQRVVIQLNRTKLQQWPEGEAAVVRDIEPDRAGWNPPVIHTVKNVGALPLRGIVLELQPQGALTPSKADMAKAMRALAAQPIVDGHNDLPWRIREDTVHPMDVEAYDLRRPTPGHTDIARLKAGHVGAQFWSIYIPGEKNESAYKAKGAVASTPGYARVQLEQIDIARQVIAKYPALEWSLSAAAIDASLKRGKIGSLLGLEGGHAIENSLSLLRTYYELGARYMTLTHNVTLDWADAALDTAKHGGLTPFGREVVREMNRLGMLIDLSHVSPGVMSNALDVTAAPVIFSHSGSRALVDHARNVPDTILARLPKNGGVVMVPFVTAFVSRVVKEDDDSLQARGAAWRAAHPRPKAMLTEVADVIDHVRRVAGVDHVGVGSDFDGISETVVGLEDVSKFPALFAELARRGWSEGDLRKLAGGNVLRVLRQAEVVSARLRRERTPSIATIEQLDRRPPTP